ncbi:MAG: peptidylprolyl isomerase [Clostridiales bacterium]|nr:peptidylprolyl isomerase [Clostridiales bacterium]
MNKKIIVIFILLILVSTVLLTGCSKDPDARTVVAKISGEKVFKTQYNQYWKNAMEQYNIKAEDLVNPEYSEQLAELKDKVLEYCTNQIIMKKELVELGHYNLTEAEHTSAKASRDTVVRNALATMQEQMLAELPTDYTDKDLADLELKYTQIVYDDFGLTETELLDYFIDEIALDNAKAALISVSVSDEDVNTLFNSYVEKDKDLFEEDLSAYEYYTTQGDYKPYYIPEGFRYIRHVLIKFEDEIVQQIGNLRSAGDDKTANELVAKSLETIQDEADEALTLLQSSDITMNEAIKEYNDDPGMVSFPNGYLMFSESKTYVPEFTEAGMALKKLGDISGLVATDYGYHILEYFSDVPSGPIDIDVARNALYDELINIRNIDAWSAQVLKWAEKYDVEYFYEKLIDKQ